VLFLGIKIFILPESCDSSFRQNEPAVQETSNGKIIKNKKLATRDERKIKISLNKQTLIFSFLSIMCRKLFQAILTKIK